jgi:bifunctional non-homologous end joining protein LigD
MSDQDRPPRPSLARYRDKRNPARTNEPFGALGDAQPETEGGTRSGAFVVHLHRATRLHYDLRLEMGGALLSFALPKGPTLDPAEKHLAVRTEEHPLDYVDFEDVIPAGNYGAGPMIVWDRGAVRYLEQSAEEGLAAGKLDFVLSGFKLKGRFALVKIKDKAGTGSDATWLLLKKSDAHARSGGSITEEEPRSVLSGLTVEELARAREGAGAAERRAAELGAPVGVLDGRALSPMLCSTLDAPPTGDEWVSELKLDGVRIVADKRGDEIALSYRSRRDTTAAYPEVVRALAALPVERVVLDGEIVAFDDAGVPSFQRLQQRIHLGEKWSVARASLRVPAVYLVFDVLAVGERVTTGLPLTARRELLRMLVPHTAGFVRALDYVDGHATELFDFCRARKLEGIVVKRKTAPYRPGPRRTSDWVKIKCERDESFVVLGWTRGNDARSRLGALDLGAYDAEGKLVVRGKVGSGLDEKAIDALLAKLEPLATKEKLFGGKMGSAPNGRTLVRPEVVVSVRYLGWSDEGMLRFPVFRGIDPDRAPSDCRAAPHGDAQVTVPALEAPRFRKEQTARAAAARALGTEETTEPERQRSRSHPVKRAALTNQDKIFWPEDGYTKGDLCRYYEAISHVILPYLRDRPVVVVRYPDGIHGKNFFQWNVPWGFPAWMRHIPLSKDDEDKKKRVFLVNDVESLLTVVNLGCIPIHVLARRELSLDQCDFVTIDLDVELSTFATGVRLATALGELLERIGLPGYAKTSGQSGLHVLVPMGPGVGFETGTALAVLLGRLLASRFPDDATMEREIKRRGSRVYVDVFQTHARKTIVAPYSVRAVPGATVSTPLAWSEVGAELDPKAFTIRTVPERVKRLGDPMRPMLDARPDVPAAVARLGELLG